MIRSRSELDHMGQNPMVELYHATWLNTLVIIGTGSFRTMMVNYNKTWPKMIGKNVRQRTRTNISNKL